MHKSLKCDHHRHHLPHQEIKNKSQIKMTSAYQNQTRKAIQLDWDEYHNYSLELSVPNHCPKKSQRSSNNTTQGTTRDCVCNLEKSWESISLIFHFFFFLLLLQSQKVERESHNFWREKESEKNVFNGCENVRGRLVDMSHSRIVHRDRGDHGPPSWWYWGTLSAISIFKFFVFYLCYACIRFSYCTGVEIAWSVWCLE